MMDFETISNVTRSNCFRRGSNQFSKHLPFFFKVHQIYFPSFLKTQVRPCLTQFSGNFFVRKQAKKGAFWKVLTKKLHFLARPPPKTSKNSINGRQRTSLRSHSQKMDILKWLLLALKQSKSATGLIVFLATGPRRHQSVSSGIRGLWDCLQSIGRRQ